MATVAEDLLVIAQLEGMDPRARREMMDEQAELDAILSGDWIQD